MSDSEHHYKKNCEQRRDSLTFAILLFNKHFMKKNKEICIAARSLFEIYKKEEIPEEISDHLESCPDCLLVFNRDSNLRKRLKEVIKKTPVPPALEVSITEFIKKDISLVRFAGRIS